MAVAQDQAIDLRAAPGERPEDPLEVRPQRGPPADPLLSSPQGECRVLAVQSDDRSASLASQASW